MKIDKNWFKLYEQLYGTKFNRLLTIGNGENNYINYTINTLEELEKQIEEFQDNELYISVYSYNTEENFLRWGASELDLYEKYADKNCIIFRFREDSNVINEEVRLLEDIQKFMFIRRTLTLGFDRGIIDECKKTYNFFKTHFNVNGKIIFNGYTECILYISKEELTLNSPSLTYYHILKLVEEKLELKKLVYENIEPYAQLMPLPGSQNRHSRMYVQLFNPEDTYAEVMKKSQDIFFNSEQLFELKQSEKLHKFIEDMDKEVTKHKKDEKFNFDKIWVKI